VAYSTLAQIGYLFLMFPLALDPGGNGLVHGAALTGGLLQAVSHATAKAGMFMAAGLVYAALGHDRIAELGPALRSLPAVALAVGLAGVALIGLPPSGTFVAKWILLSESLRSGQWWWAPVVLLGTLLASGYVYRLLANAFGPGAQPAAASGGSTERPSPIGRAIQTPALLMTLIAVVLLGLGAEPLWGLMSGSPP